MLLREDKLSEIADELNEEREARGANVSPSAQAASSARTATATAVDAERARAAKAEKTAAQKLTQAQDKAAKKLVADAKKGGGGGGGASQGGGGGGGGGDKRPKQPCYGSVRDGSCKFGDGCKFSHYQTVCDAASAAPAAVSAMWSDKWNNRVNPQRGSDPAARVHGSKKVLFTGILAKDRWEICEQTAHKCFKRHVECNGRCKCAMCSKPQGKKWPELVDADLKPSGHPGGS